MTILADIQPSISLTEPIDPPAQYASTIQHTLAAVYTGLRWTLQEGFGFYNLPNLTPDQLARTLFAEQLCEIARIAAGLITDPDALAIGQECIQSVCETLFAGAGSPIYHIPAEFWSLPVGQMIALARLRISRDGLITIKDAADRLGITTQAVTAMLDDGRLMAYIDPAAPARQGRRLVSRRDIESRDK